MENRPVRKSSEAPEVVTPEIRDPKVFWTYAERLKRSGIGTLYGKQIDDNETESTKYPPSPRAAPSSSKSSAPKPTVLFSPNVEVRSIGRPKRSFGLFTTILLAVIAFLMGGGIGGGVGGALLAKNKSHQCSSNATPTPTSTGTAPVRTGNFIVDTAGCPAIENGQLWNSTTPGKQYSRICYKDTVGKSGANIVMGNLTVASLDNCLNTCAITNGCVAATWYMFSVADPSKNAVCFLKNNVGTQTPQTDGDALVTGILV